MSESSPDASVQNRALVSRAILEAGRGGVPIAVATVIAAPAGAPVALGEKLVVRNDGSRVGNFGGGDFETAVAEDALTQLTTVPRVPLQTFYYQPEGAHIHRLEAKAGAEAYEVMIEVTEAPATLLVIGGGHIGLSLATIGAHVGFSVAVQDDRQAFANPERFPMADRILTGDIAASIEGFPIGGNTYVVLVSRGHKQDEDGLRLVVSRGAAFVGMIGSRRRVSTVLRHLAEEGYPLEDLERVHTPIGLDIGAETPEEIAVSIMAEIIMNRRGGSGRVMQEGRPKIRVGEGAAEESNA
jgi:xanthine dehydrogenase accessory factor